MKSTIIEFCGADEASLRAVRQGFRAIGVEVPEPGPYELRSPDLAQFAVPVVTIAVVKSLARIIEAYIAGKRERTVEVKTGADRNSVFAGYSIGEIESLLIRLHRQDLDSKGE